MKVLLLALGLLLAATAWCADEDYNNKTYREIADTLRCPTCQGLSVLDSDAKFAVQIKDEVTRQLKEGKSRKEILTFFETRYGTWILREPPKEGFNLVVWGFPLVLLVLGPVLVWFFVWRKTKTVSSAGVRSVASILEDMEAELKAIKGRA